MFCWDIPKWSSRRHHRDRLILNWSRGPRRLSPRPAASRSSVRGIQESSAYGSTRRPTKRSRSIGNCKRDRIRGDGASCSNSGRRDHGAGARDSDGLGNVVPPRPARPLRPAKEPDQNQWEIEAESGRIEVRLYDLEPGESLVASNLWISGTTQIDLRKTTNRGGGLVNWTTDWTVDLDPRNPKPLVVGARPRPGADRRARDGGAGLFSGRIGPGARLVVTLGEGLKSSTDCGSWLTPKSRQRVRGRSPRSGHSMRHGRVGARR